MAAVPTGINAGVGISPLAVAIRPFRAGPSAAWVVKLNGFNILQYQHGIAKAVKTVFHCYGLGIGPKHPPCPGQSRHQHQ